MNAKVNKISAVEKLRIKKVRLKIEEQEYIHELDKHVIYLYENFGSLVADAGWTAVRSQFPPFIQSFLPGGDNRKAIGTSQKQASAFVKKYPHIGALTNHVVDLAPIVFNGLKPILISFALKKAKKLIFK